MKTVRTNDGRTVKVVINADQKNHVISSKDMEMDRRARQAVRSAVEKAKFCKKPIAKYDKAAKKAYIQYANGEKKYVE